MQPQYVAPRSSCMGGFEAFPSQSRWVSPCGYLSKRVSHKLRVRFTQWTYTSRVPGVQNSSAHLDYNCDRRLRCPRASNCWPYWALHSQHPHAHAKHQLKSLSWLTPRRSQSSRFTQVSTSNLLAGQAATPVLTPPADISGVRSWR
jgi:hypothetical protein